MISEPRLLAEILLERFRLHGLRIEFDASVVPTRKNTR